MLQQLLLCLILLWPTCQVQEWGFYGHRLINKMAVYTLPTELIGIYKQNLDYVESHAVDPDKRRYAVIGEAQRHYIDIDHWGENPFDLVPKYYVDAVVKFGQWRHINGDTSEVRGFDEWNSQLAQIAVRTDANSLVFSTQSLRDSVIARIYNRRLESPWSIEYVDGQDTINLLLQDEFSDYGVLPYCLQEEQNKLTKAFVEKDVNKIIQLSTSFAHYISDAHVPLHTTVNYNGQLTDQIGIHAFWESRIPELFAAGEYDFFVGKAKYIEDTRSFFWKTIEESHALVADVLSIEKSLSIEYPQSQQFCYEDRLDQNVRIQCPEFARAYQNALKGTVEKRMQQAILSIGSCWYTAWVDAGQPIFNQNDLSATIIPSEYQQKPNIRNSIRPHE